MQDQPTFVKSYAIVAYQFQASLYCPGCIGDVLASDARYDGWKLAAGVRMDAESDLNEIAHAFGINRQDETSFDSSDFPKVVFADQVDGETCEACGGEL